MQLLAQTAPLVSYRYNSQGDLSEVTDEHGRSTRAFEYDRQHRMTGHRHLGGPWSRYTYASDEPGAKVVAHSTEGGLGYQFDYQPQETIVTDSLGRTTRYGFDGEGDRKRLARQTDALGHTTQLVYNLYGHLVQHIDPLGQTTRYRYPDPAKEPLNAEHPAAKWPPAPSWSLSPIGWLAGRFLARRDHAWQLGFLEFFVKYVMP